MPTKLKLPKLPRLMNNGQKEEFKRDILKSFEGCDINEEGIYLWAQSSSLFYNWFYPRFEQRLLIRQEKNELDKCEPTYKPMFMEWSLWEIQPCFWTDFINGLLRSRNNEYRPIHNAMRRIYVDYLNMFKESHNLVK